jgi:hypothetical protein
MLGVQYEYESYCATFGASNSYIMRAHETKAARCVMLRTLNARSSFNTLVITWSYHNFHPLDGYKNYESGFKIYNLHKSQIYLVIGFKRLKEPLQTCSREGRKHRISTANGFQNYLSMMFIQPVQTQVLQVISPQLIAESSVAIIFNSSITASDRTSLSSMPM